MRLRKLIRTATGVVVMLLTTPVYTHLDVAGAENLKADCSITLSGAKTETLACAEDREGMLWIATNESLVGFMSADTGPTVVIAIKFLGAPTTKTYRSSDPDAKQGVWVRSGTNSWIAMGSKEPNRAGSYSLTLSSVKERPLARDTKGYDLHGTLTATLEPDRDTGAKGTVTLEARF